MEQRWLPIPWGNRMHHPPLIKTDSVFTEDVCLTSPLLPQCLPHSPIWSGWTHIPRVAWLRGVGLTGWDRAEEQEAEGIFSSQAVNPDSPSQLELQTPGFNPFTHPFWPQWTPSCDTRVSQELTPCECSLKS